MKCFVLDQTMKNIIYYSNEPNATLFIGNMPAYAAKIKELGKNVIYVGDSFMYGLLGNSALLPAAELETYLTQLEIDTKAREAERAKIKGNEEVKVDSTPAAAVAAPVAGKAKQFVRTKDTIAVTRKEKGKKISEKITGVTELVVFAYTGSHENIFEYLKTKTFIDGDQTSQ
jgi:hypothetical protein